MLAGESLRQAVMVTVTVTAPRIVLQHRQLSDLKPPLRLRRTVTAAVTVTVTVTVANRN
jgi:hypothetical protein